MTWKELQPCLLPLAGPKQPSQAQAAKAKRKLQPAAPQGRAKPQTAAVAVPGSGSQEGAGASGGMLSREGHRGDEEAELADEPEKQDVCPPTRVSTGRNGVHCLMEHSKEKAVQNFGEVGHECCYQHLKSKLDGSAHCLDS